MGTILGPIIFLLLYLRAKVQVAGRGDVLSDVRIAAATLGTALTMISAVAAWIHVQSGFENPSCLIELPPLNVWGHVMWTLEVLLTIAFVFWVWAGPGARQLAHFLSAISPKRPSSQTYVRLGSLAMALVPVIIAFVEVSRLARPYCKAA